MIQEHRHLLRCFPLFPPHPAARCFTISLQPEFLSRNGVPQTSSPISNVLCAISWWLSSLGWHRIRNLHFWSPREGEVGSQGLNIEIFSFPRPSRWSWMKADRLLKAYYLVQKQEDTFKLGQNRAPCFPLKYKWATFVYPGSYLLGSKGLPFSTIIIIFLKMLFFSWPCPDDRNQCVLAHSAGYFLKETESLLPITHLPREIQDTQQKQSSISNILALPMSRAWSTLMCTQLWSFVSSINIYWVSAVCLAQCYRDTIRQQ